MAEEIKKDEKPKIEKSSTPDIAPMSLNSFLNMFTLVRHIRFKYERLHRLRATESLTYKEWSDITGLGKEDVKK